jgi:hypothetical protein
LPAEELEVVVSWPVPWFIAVTVTLGTALPAASVTVPPRLPELDCATAEFARYSEIKRVAIPYPASLCIVVKPPESLSIAVLENAL